MFWTILDRWFWIIVVILGVGLVICQAEQTTPLKEGTVTGTSQQQQPTLEQLQFQLLGSQVQALQAENALLRRLLDDCKGTPNKEKK